ncbi:MAG: hypothetical protein HY775_12765 [Acidobacteria bacterium]|nr:hypothetical protein [Acidobacteriota bacterium]
MSMKGAEEEEEEEEAEAEAEAETPKDSVAWVGCHAPWQDVAPRRADAFRGEAFLATTPEEVRSGAGSVYHQSYALEILARAAARALIPGARTRSRPRFAPRSHGRARRRRFRTRP